MYAISHSDSDTSISEDLMDMSDSDSMDPSLDIAFDDQEVNSLEGKVTDEIVVAAGSCPIKIIKTYMNLNTTITNILPHLFFNQMNT